MKLSKLSLCILIIVISASNIFSQTKASKQKAKPVETKEVVLTPTPQVQRLESGAIIHLTVGIDNPEKVLHALSFALELAKDYKVLIYMDLKGPEIVVNKLPSVESRKYEPSKSLINKLLQKGVQIVVHQPSLELLNYTQYDLVKGVKFSETRDFFDFVNGKIITFDY